MFTSWFHFKIIKKPIEVKPSTFCNMNRLPELNYLSITQGKVNHSLLINGIRGQFTMKYTIFEGWLNILQALQTMFFLRMKLWKHLLSPITHNFLSFVYIATYRFVPYEQQKRAQYKMNKNLLNVTKTTCYSPFSFHSTECRTESWR